MSSQALGTIFDLIQRVLPLFLADSWATWRALIRAIFVLGLSAEELALFQSLTGRTDPPSKQPREVWLIVGRRAGKSFISALIAIYLCCCRTYTLAPGERGIFMLIAADRRQARVLRRYIHGLMKLAPSLRNMIAPEGDTPGSRGETQEAIFLTNGLVIEIHTASSVALRGYTVVGAVCDEVAFWANDDAADPDTEVLNALRPAMATVPDAMLVLLSSPYARRGELWRAYQRYYGEQDDDVLVVQADTRTLNPLVSQSVIDRAHADDPSSAAAEYGAQFRRDVETFIDRDILRAAVAQRGDRPRLPGIKYVGFTDPAGGSGGDSFTLAIAHREASGRIVVDLVREQRPPFSPADTTATFVELLKSYGISDVYGDRYAGDWPAEQFAKGSIQYRISEKPKSDLYLAFLPLLNSGRLELPSDEKLSTQFERLERRTARGGRDSIDHPPKGHDDLANSCAGAVVVAAGPIEDGFFAHIRAEAERLRAEQANA